MSNPLRNPHIDYERGWFSVTVQVAHNKSLFGAIVGEKCELNALGLAVRQAASVWVGSIRPGGSLETLLKAITGKEVE